MRALLLVAVLATAVSAQAPVKPSPPPRSPASPTAGANSEDIDVAAMDLSVALPAIRQLLADRSLKIDPELRSILTEILPLGQAALNGTLTADQVNSGRLERLLERMVERSKMDSTTLQALKDNAQKAAAAKARVRP